MSMLLPSHRTVELAVSGSSDRTLRIWNLETGHSRVLARDAGVFDAVAVTPDGRYAVSEDAVDNLRIWNLETGHSRVLEGHTGGVTAIAVTPDGGVPSPGVMTIHCASGPSKRATPPSLRDILGLLPLR